MLQKTILPYDWPCRNIVPAEKQMFTTAFMVYNPHSFVLNDPGTGKTLSALWAADFIMSQYERYKVRGIIISPLSTLTRVWKKEIYTHFLGRRNCVVVHGTVAQRMKALNTRTDFYIMNFDGVKVPAVFNKLLLMDNIKIAIIDESTAFKVKKIKRSKRARTLLHSKPYLWLMSGTPTPQSPLDAHGQAALCHPGYTESMTAFKGRVMMQVSTHKFLPRQDAYDQAKAILQPSIRIPRHAMHDLPPSIPVHYKVPFSSQQQKLYDLLRKEFKAVIDANGGHITAVHEGALRLKLLQIACGAVYDANRTVHLVDASPRLQRLREIIHECPNKLIIFASFTSVLTLLFETFKKEVTCEVISGSVSRKQRDKIFTDFQEKDNPKVIFADPRTMSHGLTLTRATITCWYGPTDSNETYTQANYRIDRPGKTQETYIAQIGSCPVEWEIYERLDLRQSMQGVMLKMMEGTGEE
jgi:SNF2 family DNA or RNA helicase